ncbi:MAG: TolC family outer membrane protein [Rickettsiales bacterium]
MKKINAVIVLSCLLSSTAFSTSLSEALVSTYQNNPELIAAREKLKATDEKMFQAISGFLPKVIYSAKKTNQKKDTTTDSSSLASSLSGQQVKTDDWVDTKSKESSISLQQNLFNGGQDVMAVKIAKYSIEAGRQELITNEQKILLEAIDAYLDVMRTKEVQDISRENYLAYEKKYNAIKEKLEVGVAKKADLADAAARKANAATNLIVSEGYYNSALATYMQIIGIEAENVHSCDILTTPPKDQLELLQKSLATNPELQNVSFQKKIADINVISNAASMLPSVDLGGSIGKNWQDTRGSNLNQPYTNSKSVAISVTIPIYNKGLEYSNIRSASADAARLKYSLKNARAAVTQNSVKSWTEYVSAKDAAQSTKEAVKAGEVALEAKQQEYEEGLGTLTDLLDAQENLFQYKIKLTQAEKESALSYYKMASLMGKLTAKDLELSTKLYNPAENYDKVKVRLIGL